MCLGTQRNVKNQASGRAGNEATPGPGHLFLLGYCVPSLLLSVHLFLSLLPSTRPLLLFIVSFSSLLTSRLTLITSTCHHNLALSVLLSTENFPSCCLVQSRAMLRLAHLILSSLEASPES